LKRAAAPSRSGWRRQHEVRTETDIAAAMNTSIAVMIFRMRPLPRRHRIAHLRALIGRLPVGSIRRAQLVALLHDEMTLPRGNGGRAE
jgi:hypothetical protein